MRGSTLSERRYIALSVFFMFLLVLISGGMAVFVLSDSNLHHSLRFARAAVEIDRVYRGEVNWNRLFDSTIEGMFDRLDRHSGYMEPQQFDRINEELSGSYAGIGVTVVEHGEGLFIVSVRESGPAADVDLLSGDIIVRVDNVDLQGLSIGEASGLLRGPEGTEVALGVFRPVSQDSLSVVITRRRINLEHIPFAGFTSDGMIYIRLLDFDAGASRDLEAALDSLLACEGIAACGVILDIRGNPGGLFSEAYQVADLFLDGGKFIVGTAGRSRWNEEKHYSSGHDRTGGLPIAVIVDRGSASSAEIAAGALKQLDRAILVGDTTFGKGLVQGFSRFPDGSALRLTVSRYYLEGGVFLNEFDSSLNDIGDGLPPDHFVMFREREPFPMALEYSLLLNQFASLYQDEIIAASEDSDLDNSWIARFEDHAREEQFDYVSPVTEMAELLREIAQLESVLPVTCEATRELVNKAQQVDRDQFRQYGRYIKMRLQQIAYERKFGSHAAYGKVIVPELPVIRLAARLLRGED